METLKEGKSLPMQQVLMFDGRKRLCAMFASQYAAAAALKVSKQAMNQAVNGTIVTTGGFYFRLFNPNIVVDYTMLGKLNLDMQSRSDTSTKRRHGIKPERKHAPREERKKRRGCCKC